MRSGLFNIKALILITCITCPAITAYAENSVIIEQLNPGSVYVKQSGSDNSATITQSNTKDPSPVANATSDSSALGTPETVHGSDYQNAILNNPYTSAQARAQILATQKDAVEIDNTKKVGKTPDLKKTQEQKNLNKIQVSQTGNSNKVSTYQGNDSNSLSVDQEGKHNNVKREQTGINNESRIIQNGEVIEDTTQKSQ